MTDEEYLNYELDKARPEPGGVVRIKARAEHGGESKWLRLSAEDYERVIAALVGRSA